MFLLWGLAWAADCASPLSEEEIRDLVSAATEAVGNDDVAGFRSRYRDLTKRVPCLAGPMPKGPWAEMLVLDAIVRLADGQDVTAPLSTARAIAPDVELPPFLAELKVSAPSSGGAPVPSGLEVYVDGVRISSVPTLEGDHVLQRAVGGTWESRVSDSLPRTWTSQGASRVIREVGAEDTDRWLLFSAAPALSSLKQRPDAPGDYLPEAQRTGMGVVFAGEARIGFGPAGVFGRGAVPLWLARLSGGGLRIDPSVELGALIMAGPVEAEVGALLAFTPLLEGGKNRERLDLVPALGLRWVEESVDAGLSVGAWLDSVWVRGRGGWSTDAGAGRLRIGLEIGGHSRSFVQSLPERDRQIRQTVYDAGVSFGLLVR